MIFVTIEWLTGEVVSFSAKDVKIDANYRYLTFIDQNDRRHVNLDQVKQFIMSNTAQEE